MASVDVTRIASNIGALNALNSLQNINKSLALHQTRLQTGRRINSAADDPAGLTIATKMLARSEGLKVALSNIGDANNMLAVAEGGMSKINDILVQMRSKAEQAASDTLGQTERQAIQTQLSAYAEQIDSIVSETKWNGVQLLNGTANKQFQTGVDQGEVTSWQQTQNLSSGQSGLLVSTAIAQNMVSSAALGTGVSLIAANQTIASNTTALGTGSYNVKISDVAAAAGTGKLTANSLFGGSMTLTANATAVGGTQFANGTSNIAVKNFVAVGAGVSTIDYSTDGGVTFKTANMTGNIAAANVTLELDAGATHVGNGGITLTVAMNTASTTTGVTETSTADYIQKGFAKAVLQTADGAPVSVVSGGRSSQSFYLDGSAATNITDTGRGLSVTSDTLANMTTAKNAGTLFNFSYTAKNAYSVDVSTANIASNYMQVVNNAMDVVNSNMASLGSLMARLTFKEDQIATAQVNVESSYSRIMNANMAEEQVNASKFAILQQTATAMLAQANQAPQNLLSLFR